MPSSQTFSNVYQFGSGGRIFLNLGATNASITDVSDGAGDDTNVLVNTGNPQGRDTFNLTYTTDAGVQTTTLDYVSRDARAGQPSSIYGRSDALGNFLITDGTFEIGSAVPPLETTPYAVACFCPGTLIRTVCGDIAVEALQEGDLAITASGAIRPVIWVGHRKLDCGDEMLSHDQQPICIRRGAFGSGLPARDLRLSPGHPVLVGADPDGDGGVLVPVMCLINGTTIIREQVQTVTYWHVELDAHDILLAEGLSAESYYDMGGKAWFAGEDGRLLDPDLIPPGLKGRCRPVAIDGPIVEAERRRIGTLFQVSLTEQCAWPVQEAWFAA